jgi:hypothetical protein
VPACRGPRRFRARTHDALPSHVTPPTACLTYEIASTIKGRDGLVETVEKERQQRLQLEHHRKNNRPALPRPVSDDDDIDF